MTERAARDVNRQWEGATANSMEDSRVAAGDAEGGPERIDRVEVDRKGPIGKQ